MDSEKTEQRKMLKQADISPYITDIKAIEKAMTLENLRASTLCSYHSYLCIFAAWLVLCCNAIAFAEVTVEVVRNFLDFLKTKLELSPNTINGYLAAVRKMFHYLRDEELSKRAVPDLAVDEHMPRVPSVKQVQAMLKACLNVRELLFLALLITTGIRLNELINLRFSDIRKELSVIYISADAKGRADGYVPLSNYVVKLLTKYCREFNAAHPQAQLKPDDYIFFGKDRSVHDSDYQMRKIFIAIQKRAGLEEEHFRPHAMRHYFAFQLYLQSHDLFLVKRLLRHRTLAATLKYLVMASSAELREKYANPGDVALKNLIQDLPEKEGGENRGSSGKG